MKMNIKINTEKIQREYISLCGHKTRVFFPSTEGEDTLRGEKGFFVTFTGHKKTPRVLYKEVQVDELTCVLEEDGIKDLPLPLSGRKLIVSRDTLRAIQSMDLKLHKAFPSLYQLTPGQEKKIRKVSFSDIALRMPVIHGILQSVPGEERRSLFMDLKRYLYRDDIVAPGQQVRGADNKIVAAYKLLKEVR
jgi:hypothetical protein